MSKVTHRNILDDMPGFTNTQQQLSLKACPIFVEAVWEWSVLSCGLYHLKVVPEGGMALCGYRSCRSHGRAFSKASSRTKALCNPQLPWIGHWGLSAERGHRLKVSGMQQILRITHTIVLLSFANKWMRKELLPLCSREACWHASRVKLGIFLIFWHGEPKGFTITGLCGSSRGVFIRKTGLCTWCLCSMENNVLRVHISWWKRCIQGTKIALFNKITMTRSSQVCLFFCHCFHTDIQTFLYR